MLHQQPELIGDYRALAEAKLASRPLRQSNMDAKRDRDKKKGRTANGFKNIAGHPGKRRRKSYAQGAEFSLNGKPVMQTS